MSRLSKPSVVEFLVSMELFCGFLIGHAKWTTKDRSFARAKSGHSID